MNELLSDVEQYVFGDFILKKDGIIFYNDKKNKLPSKELSVLILLLNSAGLLLSADEIIKKIWRGDLGAEKSLARCIYVLRKILQENKDNRYIDVVYGKGYRFIRPVTRLLPENKKKSKSMLAILPFKMENQVDSLIIHDFLLQALSKYTPLGLSILPSILTNNCKNYDDIVTLLDKTQPDYYLAGTMIICNSQPCLRIELVHAGEHSIVHRESIILEKDINFSCFILQHILDEFLPNHIPCLQNKSSKIKYKKSAPLKEKFYYYTPGIKNPLLAH